jgi:hypothetical protein
MVTKLLLGGLEISIDQQNAILDEARRTKSLVEKVVPNKLIDNDLKLKKLWNFNLN